MGLMLVITPVFANESSNAKDDGIIENGEDLAEIMGKTCPYTKQQFNNECGTCIIDRDCDGVCWDCENYFSAVGIGDSWTANGEKIQWNGGGYTQIVEGDGYYFVENPKPEYNSALDKLLIIGGLRQDLDSYDENFFMGIAKWVYYILFAAGVLFGVIKSLIAGFNYFNAAGNPQLQEQYKSDLKEPAIGVIAFLIAITVVEFLIQAFGFFMGTGG